MERKVLAFDFSFLLWFLVLALILDGFACLIAHQPHGDLFEI
jgi:hypothetical protein